MLDPLRKNMTPDQEIRRAMDAANVLENPAYKEAMQAMRQQIVDQWKTCPIRDKEGQILLLQLAKLSDKFENILNGMIETGKLAQHKLDIDAARNENVVRGWIRRKAG